MSCDPNNPIRESKNPTETLQIGSHLSINNTVHEVVEHPAFKGFGESLLAWDHLEHCFDKGVSFVQVEADLLGGENRRELLARAASAGIVVVARQPFASGLLARDPDTWGEEDFGGESAKLERARVRGAVVRKAGDPFKVILYPFVEGQDGDAG